MKVSLMRVRLNSGGYDASGCYWGVDAPLYVARRDGEENGSMGLHLHLRASDREDAKAKVRRIDSSAEFYR